MGPRSDPFGIDKASLAVNEPDGLADPAAKRTARVPATPAPVIGPTWRVALLGPYVSRNLGDTSTQMAVISELRRRVEKCEILGIAPEPEDTLRSLGIPAFPLTGAGAASGPLASQWGSPRGGGLLSRTQRMARFIQTLDLLIVSGGGQLDDYWGGAWGHPWTLLHWSALARMHRVPVAFLGVGVDRLETPLSRRFARWSLDMASLIAFRDANSRDELQRIGMRKPSRICADLAFGLRSAVPAQATQQAPFAVINPVAQITWARSADPRHERYLANLVELGVWLAGQGLSLRIVCSQPKMDIADAERIARMLAERQVSDVHVCTTTDVQDYIDQVRSAEVVAASRLHGVILALVAGAPVVALSPLPKVEQVMADVGLGRFCLQLQDFSSSKLIELTAELLRDVEGARRHVSQVTLRLAAELDTVYEEVIALLRDRGSKPGDT